MHDPRLAKMATVLVEYSLEIQERDRLAIRAPCVAEPLIRLVYEEALKRGAFPEAAIQLPDLQLTLYEMGNDEQLDDVSPRERHLFEEFDALLTIRAPVNTRTLSGIPTEKTAKRRLALKELNRTLLERSSRGELRWTATQFPTHAAAQEAEMSLEDYEDFVFGACLLNDADPVKRWREVHDDHERMIAFLEQRSQFRIVGPGIDLTYEAPGRTWINSDGHKNFPSGEVFTSPLEDSMKGTVRFDYPAIVSNREVAGVELVFEGGVVVEARAEKGYDYLMSLLDTDDGARRVGEVAIGTNYGIDRFTRNILFDEKIGGTMHIAVGAAYPETGGSNSSAIHVDLIANMKDGGAYYADGELFYENGKFLI
jgi:aminopeptidase